MRTNGNAMLACEAHRAAQHGRVARMKSRSDVGGGNRSHQRLVIADGIGAERFAHVGVQINMHRSMTAAAGGCRPAGAPSEADKPGARRTDLRAIVQTKGHRVMRCPSASLVWLPQHSRRLCRNQTSDRAMPFRKGCACEICLIIRALGRLEWTVRHDIVARITNSL